MQSDRGTLGGAGQSMLCPLLWMAGVPHSLYSFLQLGILVITATMAAHWLTIELTH